MPALGQFIAVNLDCADPPALAAFYQRLGGGEVTYSDENYASAELAGGATFYFQRAEGHRRSTWPDPAIPQQSHLDFYVDDLDKAEALLLESGATKPEFQPNAERWRVLADPAGHPFCICVRSE
jgi:hypothetical protein